jgi:hypothetical protein
MDLLIVGITISPFFAVYRMESEQRWGLLPLMVEVPPNNTIGGGLASVQNAGGNTFIALGENNGQSPIHSFILRYSASNTANIGRSVMIGAAETDAEAKSELVLNMWTE